MISVENITKQYGELQAVKNVSFSIGKGEIVGLLGPNGAGKTTLMKILTCYHYPDFGTVSITGEDIFRNPERIKSVTGYLPENAPVYSDLTVYEYLDFIADARLDPREKKEEAIDRVTQICGLDDVFFKPIEQLSKGYRQRTGLAQAIIHDPEILILDEPTTGLDPNQIVDIRKLVQDIGKEKTVILSTHILREVELMCNRVLIMNNGGIAASGTPGEISSQLEGGNVLSVTLRTEGSDLFKEGAEKSPVVNGVLGTVEEEEYTTIHFTVTDTIKGGEALFNAAVESGTRLAELKRIEKSLEDIFMKLTKKEGT